MNETYNDALAKLHTEIVRLQAVGDKDTMDALIKASLFLMRSREESQ